MARRIQRIKNLLRDIIFSSSCQERHPGTCFFNEYTRDLQVPGINSLEDYWTRDTSYGMLINFCHVSLVPSLAFPVTGQ